MSVDYDFNAKQNEILIVLYAIAEILYLMIFIVIVYNSWRYLYRAKLGSNLVILFYVLAGIAVVSHIIFYIIMIMKPSDSPYMFDTDNFTVHEFFIYLGTNTMVAIGWLVATTMFHLMITVRLIFNLVTPERALIQNRRAHIFAVVINCFQFAFIGLIPIIFSAKVASNVVSDGYMVFYTILTVYYFTIVFMLRKTL